MSNQEARGWEHAVGYLLLLITAVSWAGAWVTARIAAHDLSPVTVTWARFVVASIALVPAWWLLERHKKVRVSASDFGVLVLMALTGIVAYNVLFLIGIRLAPASDGVVVTPGLGAFFTLLFGSLAARLWPAKSSWWGTLLCLAGVVLIGVSSLRSGGASSSRFVGDLVYAGSAAAWGLYTILGKRIAGRIPAVSAILIPCFVGVVLLTPVMLVLDGIPEPSHWSEEARFNVLYLGLVATAIGFVTYYLAVRALGIERAAPGLGLVPLFGVLGAHFLLHEELTAAHAAGGVLVMAGIVVSAGRRRLYSPSSPNEFARRDSEPSCT